MCNKPQMSVIIYLYLGLFILEINGQEKFTLLNTKDNGSVREIRVDRGTMPPSTTLPLPLPTKVPYKKIECPPEPIRIPIFSLPCNHEKDCRIFGPNLACCKDRCIRGVLVPVEKGRNIAKLSPKKTRRVTNNTTLPSTSKEASLPNQISPPVKATPASNESPISSGKLNDELICPSEYIRLPLFSLPCKSNPDCRKFGRNLLCCRNVCLQGVFPPKEEVRHAPALFGLVDRQCSAQPLAELFDVKECETDQDCNPRICCPELNSTTKKSYCRTPLHNIERLPGAKRIQEPLRNFVSYMQCTPPPPRELFPKPCNNTLDCFPNLCCQESGKKFCRPPRRSIIALVADVTTRFGAAEATRKFIERITA